LSRNPDRFAVNFAVKCTFAYVESDVKTRLKAG
jgi:hypothetical protein